MKCISTYVYEGKTYRLYVDLETRIFFILLPSFKITKYWNNKSIPEKAREVFQKRYNQFLNGEVDFS